MNNQPGTHILEAVGGDPRSIATWKRVEKGYTPAQRWTVQLGDGTSAFIKAAVNDMTAEWLRAEHLIYSEVDAGFLARMLGWEDDGAKPVLILEDLSHAVWPPPWSASLIDGVLKTLAEVRTTIPPSGVPRLDADLLNGWRMVDDDPEPFLGLGFCTTDWLHEALPSLMEAEHSTPTAGDDLVHLDVRSDNMCFVNGRMLLVDWNLACRANGLLDVAAWLPSLETEGGPAPEQVCPEAAVFAAAISGYFAARAGLPRIQEAPRVREVQRVQLRSALPWVARTLDLPPLIHRRAEGPGFQRSGP